MSMIEQTSKAQPYKPSILMADVTRYDRLPGRFWTLVDQTADCWLWKGLTDTHGYGRLTLSVQGRRLYLRAHHVSWLMHYGELPGHMQVLHNCPSSDTPLCVNPAHLWLGSQRDNLRDASAKGRMPGGGRGEHNGGAKLSAQQVHVIRERKALGTTSKALAEEYQVTIQAIDHIAARRTWKHI